MTDDNYQGFARRCAACDVDWPAIEQYVKCPGCNQDTELEKFIRPLDTGPAMDTAKRLLERRRRRDEFEVYYMLRDAQSFTA